MKQKLLFLFMALILIVGCASSPEVTKLTKEPVVQEVQPVKEIDSDGLVDCKSDFSCFEEHFKICKPTVMEYKVSDSFRFMYEVIGPKDSGCEIKHTVVDHPDPEWFGKSMNCISYTSALVFEECSGPLDDLMNKNIEAPTKIREVEDYDEPIEEPTTTLSKTQSPTYPTSTYSKDVSVDILMPKTIYSVNELIENENSRYYFENKDLAFKGAILFTEGRIGFSKRYHSLLRFNIVTGDSDNEMAGQKIVLTAFSYDQNGYSAVTSTGGFEESGTYTYQISIYSCEDIEFALSKDCGDAKADEIYTLNPIISKVQEILVN